MSDHNDFNEPMNFLLNASYPFNHQHYKRIYEKSDKIPNLFHCNICHLKLLGDKQLTEHNRSFKHQIEIEKLYTEFLDKSMKAKTAPSVAVPKRSRMTKGMLRNAAISASKMKLGEEWAKLKNEYDQYKRNPCVHPMYAKEWKIFYFRTLADITAANEDPNTFDFQTHWAKYWKHRVQVYHNKSQKKILEEIAANYEGTVLSSDSESTSSEEKHKTSRSTSSASTGSDLFDLTADKIYRSARSNVSSRNVTLSDMDLSNGSNDEGVDKDKVEIVPCTPAPKLAQSSESKQRTQIIQDDRDSTMLLTIPTEFATNAINGAVTQLTLDYLDKCKLNPDELTDDQLKTYIEYVIDTKYYERSLRSESVESQASVGSHHSR